MLLTNYIENFNYEVITCTSADLLDMSTGPRSKKSERKIRRETFYNRLFFLNSNALSKVVRAFDDDSQEWRGKKKNLLAREYKATVCQYCHRAFHKRC